jgi:hypothetical protein
MKNMNITKELTLNNKSVISFEKDMIVPLMGSVGGDNATFALNFYRNLITEYDCKTVSEKTTAQLVANAYVRIMEYSRRMEYCRISKETTNEINGYWAIIGKELDRANRQYASALIILKQLKAPALQINVKNAFIAENQQINSNQTKS